MKEEVPTPEEKKREFLYCVVIVVVLILLLLGDQIALRFIQKNPNANNAIFGSSEKTGNYQIDFLEELSLEQVMEKMKRNENILLLSSRESCETCKIYLPDLKETLENYNLKGYYINRDKEESSSAYHEFLSLEEEMKRNFSYTPYLMYFETGRLKDSIVGRVEKSEIEDFIIKNKMVS